MIKWVESRGRRTSGIEGVCDMSLSLVKNKDTDQLSINITAGVWATKFKNMPRVNIGFDGTGKELTRMYLMPTDIGGYKWCRNSEKSSTVYCRVSSIILERQFPMLKMSSICSNYNLRFDDENKCYYISIGAKERWANE